MRKINKILLIIVSAGILSSCKKDFLETGPTGSVGAPSLFTTTGNVSIALNGIYRYLHERFSNQNTPGHGGVMLQLDFMGEDINQAASNWYTSSGSGTANWVSQRNDASAMIEFPFRLYYRSIGNANAIIDQVDAAAGADADKKRLKGEALTIRAWCYHNLIQLFAKRYDAGAVPNSQPGLSMPLSATDVKLPRSTVEEVYTQIKKDLDAAIALFATASAPLNKSHLTAKSAKAIKARVAFTMQDYVLAATLAKDVIDNGGFSLMSNAAYQTGFNDLNNAEWLWGALLDEEGADTFGSYFAQISYNGNTSYIRGRPKRINSALYDQITATDVRKKMWEPAPTSANFPLPLTTYAREPYMSRKFSIRAANTTLGDVPFIRLAEMYLILAESYARTSGKETEARAALFTLAKNRDPNYTLSTNTGQMLINEILFHRRVELWGEGFRFYDLKRLNLDLDRTVVPNYVAAAVGGTLQVPAGSNLWVFVLPIAEIQANPNATQNP